MPKVLTPLQRILNGDMSGTNVVTSQPVDGRYLDQIKWQITWSGNPVGAFSYEESLDYNPVTGIGTWIDNGTGIMSPNGTAAQILVKLANQGPAFYRLVYTNASGVGVLNAWASGSGP